MISIGKFLKILVYLCIFTLSSLLWGILSGLFIAVTSLILAAAESKSQIQSSYSNSSGSRKIEAFSLLIPITGVIIINQLIVNWTAFSINSVSEEIIGLQWYWIYSSTDIANLSTLEIGTIFGLYVSNAAVCLSLFHVLLSAVDVIHAIALPGLGVKADAIPGRAVTVRAMNEINGTLSGQCSELCGTMHALMPFYIVFAMSKIILT